MTQDNEEMEMTEWYVETKNDLTDRFLGPIDSRNGFPTVHQMFRVKKETLAEAVKYFQEKFPGNVMHVSEY